MYHKSILSGALPLLYVLHLAFVALPEVVLLFVQELAGDPRDLLSPELALDNLMVEGSNFCTKVLMLKTKLPKRVDY
jgi:hypothetical protein